jgi:hypothetical protein
VLRGAVVDDVRSAGFRIRACLRHSRWRFELALA